MTTDPELARLRAELDRAHAELAEARRGARAEIEARTLALQQEKLAALSTLTGGLAHDFNNLLTVLSSGLRLLSRNPDPERREFLMQQMQDAVQKGTGITRRLVGMGQAEGAETDTLALDGAEEALRLLLAPVLGPGVVLDLHLQQGLWPFPADRAAFDLALTNLAANARMAMGDTGTVRLTLRNHALDPVAAASLSLRAGEYVELVLADSGPGLAPEVAARAFEPFFTTRAASGHVGLGLSQVMGLANQAGGTALIASAPEGGACVTLLLGRALPPKTAPTPAPASPGPADGQPDAGVGILLVEDSDTLAGLVADMLRQLGHSVVRVPDAGAAIAALGGTPIDLVFTDIVLPGGASGVDLARELARRRPGLPVVLTSGLGGALPPDVQAAQLPLLRKPYDMEALRQVIQAALRRA
ncbi:ATP-binding protein [Zavarzinia sp. CC-PAN008]|uniref:ATP-binding protein n=1 Tax=Zavarzinia sp. CC-PAN008 TaxID=3243332 RepID=UPI003F742AB8